MASLFQWFTNPIGTELNAPSTDEEATFAELAVRWATLEAWGANYGGLLVKVPSITGQYNSWVAFRNDWNAGIPDVTKTQSQTADLYNAEQVAKDAGYQNTFGDTPVIAPAIDQANKVLQTAQAISDAAPTLPDLSPKHLPWWVYVGGAAAGLVGLAVLKISLFPELTIARHIAGQEEEKL